MKRKKYTKLQILEAGQGLARVLASEVDDPNLEILDSHLRDIIAILEGKLVPPDASGLERVDIPGFGTIPVLGHIDTNGEGDNRIVWHNGNDFHPEQSRPPVKCPKCKTLTGFTDIDGDVTCVSCSLVLSWAEIATLL